MNGDPGTKEDVYATLLLNDRYLPGALVLAHSLRKHGTTHKLACLITLSTVCAASIAALKTKYDYIIEVLHITNPNPAPLAVMNREDLSHTFTKIELWNQRQFNRIVYLDADTLPMKNLDELFKITAPFAAAPELGMPDCFNSGLMVLTPDSSASSHYPSLTQLAKAGRSFDGGDQGLLNEYWDSQPDKWQRLSFGYNMELHKVYRLYMPAINFYWERIRVAHFIGRDKPWDFEEGVVVEGDGSMYSKMYGEMVRKWWEVWREVKEAQGRDDKIEESEEDRSMLENGVVKVNMEKGSVETAQVEVDEVDEQPLLQV